MSIDLFPCRLIFRWQLFDTCFKCLHFFSYVTSCDFLPKAHYYSRSFSSFILDDTNSHLLQNLCSSSRPASLSEKNFLGGPISDGFLLVSTSLFFSRRTRIVYTVPSTTSWKPRAFNCRVIS